MPIKISREAEYAPLILIVDDITTNIQLMAHALEKDYRIKFATNGQDALALANGGEKPDLILLDVMMPGMDGYEVCRHLHDSPSTCDIPVIFVTARHDAWDQVKGFASGAVDYITKPFDLTVVRARVSTHVTLRRQAEFMKTIAALDGLTGIPNRRHMDKIFEIEWRRAVRNQTSLSLLMIDVDHFKKYNDYYGHGTGDKCLQKVALALQAGCCRSGDCVTRYGGEEFTAILPESDADSAHHVAEKLRLAVETLNILHAPSDTSDCITISIGSATIVPALGQERSLLIETADKALYQAKQAGRNQVVAK
ncbi:MAG: diguanylate cyclase [Candidatus Saccharibacteria bacterium]|nr:diguanylate cyclase [Moraxellaceae bacterium]